MELSPRIIKKIKNDSDYNEFFGYLKYKITEMDTVDGLSEMSNEDAGEMAKARSLAINKLVEILRPIMEFEEKNEITEQMRVDREKKFGL